MGSETVSTLPVGSPMVHGHGSSNCSSTWIILKNKTMDPVLEQQQDETSACLHQEHKQPSFFIECHSTENSREAHPQLVIRVCVYKGLGDKISENLSWCIACI